MLDRLEAASLIVIAKANLPEWASIRSRWSSSGCSAVGGLTVNPHNSQRSAWSEQTLLAMGFAFEQARAKAPD
jgi:Asp-tRNA(Asn)/Glu-tRNA(Gln) amidotransferase A subunit family amidase